MKELLPLTLLAACTPKYEEQCPKETHALEQACDNANVVGEHPNTELHEAVTRFKMCAGEAYKVICSDDGYTNILSIEKRAR
jgi:hypothetical protein